MHAVDIYAKILAESIEPATSKAGFKRIKDGVYGRWDGDCFWRVSCSYRKVPGRDEGWIAIFLCVGFRSLAKFLCDFQANRFDDPRVPCAMAANSGHLRDPVRFHEWRVLPDSDAARIGEEVTAELNGVGRHYFATYGNLAGAVAAWTRGEVFNLGADADFYLAADLCCRADFAAARELVQARARFYAEAYQRTGNRSDKNMQDERVRFLAFLARVDS